MDTETVVVKIGTSSITDDDGGLHLPMVASLCDQVAEQHRLGRRVVVVTSGAIAAGLVELELGGERRPGDLVTLQALATVGQSALMETYRAELRRHDLVAGQVLLVPHDFVVRSQYLHARATFARLLDLGVVPVVNENDALADDEIRFGDNDRLAALVANLTGASLLVLLTDTDGLLTADPRHDADASLIEEIVEIDQQLESVAGGAGTARGSGGMASKLTAAKVAAWSGVPTVIARADRPGVVAAAVDGEPVGTRIHARESRMPARKLWIAFAVGAGGRLTVDDGARRALERGSSLLSAGVLEVTGEFEAGAAVEGLAAEGQAFAKGLVRPSAHDVRAVAGRRSDDLPDGAPHVVIHADDLVMLPGAVAGPANGA